MYACLAKFLNLDSVLNVNMVVAAFNQEKALVEAFSVIRLKLREGSFEALENMAAASLICADVTDIDTTNFRPASRYLHFKIFSWNFRI